MLLSRIWILAVPLLSTWQNQPSCALHDADSVSYDCTSKYKEDPQFRGMLIRTNSSVFLASIELETCGLLQCWVLRLDDQDELLAEKAHNGPLSIVWITLGYPSHWLWSTCEFLPGHVLIMHLHHITLSLHTYTLNPVAWDVCTLWGLVVLALCT